MNLETKDNYPLVSVCVLTYYQEKYIREALDSVLSQRTSFPFEIVIGDDCSGDGTWEIIEEYKKKYPNIIVAQRSETNRGIPFNYYNTVLKCRGKYIVELDGDDKFIDDEKIQYQVDFMEAHPEYLAAATMIRGITIIENIEMQEHVEYPPKRFKDSEFFLKDFLNNFELPSTGMIMQNIALEEKGRELLSLIPKFSNKIDDFSLCLLLLKYGRVFVLGKTTYLHYSRFESKSHNYNSLFPGIKSFEQHIALLNNINIEFGQEVDLYFRY